MLFSDISIVNEDFLIKHHQYVQTEGAVIQYIGGTKPDGYRGEEINGRGRLLIPGLVNCHSHVPMTLLRGYAEGLPLHRWLNEKVFPFEERMTEEDVYNGSVLGIAEMLSFGTTSFTDMYDHCEAIAKAVLDTGIKANISRGIVSFDDREPTKVQGYMEALSLYENFHGKGDNRLLTDMCIHSEYTSNEGLVRTVADYAREHGLRMHIHLSETRKEHVECIEKRGITPAQYMYQCGVFDNPATAAHCVYVEKEDLTIFRKKGVTVAHNPVSNLKLGSGIADIGAMQEQGIRVVLGTDGAASNNNLNLLEEMKLASLLQKGISNNPALMDPQEVLRMATTDGAASQGRLDSGQIKEGCRADLVVINIDRPHMIPHHNILNNLLYSAVPLDIQLTMVDGRVLYKDGEFTTIDIEKARYSAMRSAQSICSQLTAVI